MPTNQKVTAVPTSEDGDVTPQTKSLNVKYVLALITLVIIIAVIVIVVVLTRTTDTSHADIHVKGLCNFSDTNEQINSVFYAKKVLDVKITIAPENFEKLRYERRNLIDVFTKCKGDFPSGFNYYPANIRLNGKQFAIVGIRSKGLVGSINPTRPSLKVKMQKYNKEFTYEGHKRFTFNNQNQDPSRLTATLSYYVFRTMGVPASRSNYAHIQVNAKNFGIYANIEPIKKPMLARLFCDDSGNLYEGTGQDIVSGYSFRLEKKTNEKKNDWTDINKLVSIIEAPDNIFVEKIDSVLDLDAFIRFSCVEAMIWHWDGFGGNSNNYYIYHDPKTDKFFFIPWGADGTFTYDSFVPKGQPNITFGKSKLTRRVYKHFGSRYRNMMRKLLNERWNTQVLLAEFDRMLNLTNKYRIPNATSPWTNLGFSAAVVIIREFIRTRKSILLAELDGTSFPMPRYEPPIPNCNKGKVVGIINMTINSTWGGTFVASKPAYGSMEGIHNGSKFIKKLLVCSTIPTRQHETAIYVTDYIEGYTLSVTALKKDIKPGGVIFLNNSWLSAMLMKVDLKNPTNITYLGFLTPPGSVSFGVHSNMTNNGVFDMTVTGNIFFMG